MLHALALIVTGCLLLPAVAWGTPLDDRMDAPAPARSFFERGWEGWFWYWDPSEKREEEPKDLPSPEDGAVFDWMKRVPLETVDLDRLPTVELKVLLQAKREYALDDPTPDRVREYFLVHRAVFRRAERFTDSWEIALIREPELDSHSVLPASQVGQTVRAQVEQLTRRQRIADFAEHGGLFFFFTSTCPYCQVQSQILKRLEVSWGIPVFPVSRDGRPLPEYPDAHPDNGMGDHLGVTMVPMLFLAIPEERFMTPIGAGLLTEEEILRRIEVVLEAHANPERPSHRLP
ncbi:MAG: conjugal transfer protein TraF [Nitrospirae bacterium]|nr:MAG: conjugal transfer protein TraF [Nitrospirota bacterium]